MDRRLRYFRNPRNLGAGPNYNLAYNMAQGTYFKWLAHDDCPAPTYLEATTRFLDERPEAVLCNSCVRYIDADGEFIGVYDSGLGCADHPSPSVRFAPLVAVIAFVRGFLRHVAAERHEEFAAARLVSWRGPRLSRADVAARAFRTDS